LLRDGSYIRAALVAGFTFAALFTYVSSSSFVFVNAYGLDTAQFGAMFATSSIALVLGNQLSGLLSGRMSTGRHLMLAIGIAVLAALTLLTDAGSRSHGFLRAAIPIVVMVLGIGMALPVAAGAAMSRHPERAGAASALLGLFQFTLGGVIAPVVGATGTSSAVPMAIAVVACLMLELALHTAGSEPRRRARTGRAVVRRWARFGSAQGSHH
jgi:DHA1 family bicyclomycin/chloramphenicol resistance-like MFS transporter